MTRSENMVESNNQINPKFGKKLIFDAYIPRNIYEVFINLYKNKLKYWIHLNSLVTIVTK